jgi:hypothetical protein
MLQLVQAAPQLSRLECDVLLKATEAEPLLIGDEPFSAVCAECVFVDRDDDDDDVGPHPDTAVLLAALSSHDTLKRLSFTSIALDADELDALADVVLSRRLTSLDIFSCNLNPDSLPAFSRLLRGGSLTELLLGSNSLFEDGVSTEVCEALRGADCDCPSWISVTVACLHPLKAALLCFKL